MKEQVLEWLNKYPQFRLRQTKNKWLGGLILKKYGIEMTPKFKDQLQDIVTDILSADRLWRDILKDHPDLQGSDYHTKDVVKSQTLDKLGYKPSLWNDQETLAEFMEKE